MTTPSVTFHTNLSAFGNNTGIVVPPDALETLGAGKRPAVEVDVNGYRYRSTIGSMNGQSLISVSKAIRTETGLAAGDPIDVSLTLTTAPRDVDPPADFIAALDATPGTRAFFDALSNSLQRYHVDNINDAKTAETRARRIDRSVALFAAGEKR